ncbi:hypothetical protein [Desulfovibrio sp. TomC]|uniref:hypothetical protein n=1 Tax=Desulfovibrio sp. TomC TaxID=1562888 RepID=UPI0005757F9F|nr:hypothetical protein [Desulfovibrio sp. TomC]KHK03925.1 hypothetical protein NY78_0367 [Desulfovibrio sp. TomC]
MNFHHHSSIVSNVGVSSTWSLLSSKVSEKECLTCVNGILFSLGSNVEFSKDGIDWSVCGLVVNDNWGRLKFERIIFFKGQWYVFSTYLKDITLQKSGWIFDSEEQKLFSAVVVFSSSDLNIWVATDLSEKFEGHDFGGVCSTSDLMMLSFTDCQDNAPMLTVSRDVLSWSSVNIEYPMESVEGIFSYREKLFVIDDNKDLFCSVDGDRWKRFVSDNDCVSLLSGDMSYIDQDSGCCVVCCDGRLYVTRDIVEWIAVDEPFPLFHGKETRQRVCAFAGVIFPSVKPQCRKLQLMIVDQSVVLIQDKTIAVLNLSSVTMKPSELSFEKILV